MTMAEPDLWAAMAVAPIDADALKARSEMWESGRRSLRLGMVVTALIFVAVPATYLLESFLPLLIGAPLIVIVESGAASGRWPPAARWIVATTTSAARWHPWASR